MAGQRKHIEAGTIFTYLTVLREATKEELIENNREVRCSSVCLCKCGKICYANNSELRSGSKKSCGCYQIDNPSRRKHGKHGETTYKRWLSMKRRCKKGVKSQKYYYDKGIKVCQEWENNYESFLTDMGECPSEEHTLDRIDNNLGYYKENCRWVKNIEQSRNKSNNHVLDNTLAIDLADDAGVKRSTLYSRLQKNITDKEQLLSKDPLRTFTREEILNIRARAAAGETYADIALDYPVQKGAISKIVRRLSYKDIP